MKRFLVVCLLFLGVQSPSSAAGLNTNVYWAARYTMLSPSAYTFVQSPTINLVVPSGHVWYALNAWEVSINGAPYFQRKANPDEALELPAGTTIVTTPGSPGPGGLGFIYYCDFMPGTVDQSQDWQENYYSRLAVLRSTPLQILQGVVWGGSPVGTQASVPLPVGVNIMLRGIHNFNVSWSGLSFGIGAMNLTEEISDNHALRFTKSLLVPIYTTTFPALVVTGGSASGNSTDLTYPTGGIGDLAYQVLPTGW